MIDHLLFYTAIFSARARVLIKREIVGQSHSLHDRHRASLFCPSALSTRRDTHPCTHTYIHHSVSSDWFHHSLSTPAPGGETCLCFILTLRENLCLSISTFSSTQNWHGLLLSLTLQHSAMICHKKTTFFYCELQENGRWWGRADTECVSLTFGLWPFLLLIHLVCISSKKGQHGLK